MKRIVFGIVLGFIIAGVKETIALDTNPYAFPKDVMGQTGLTKREFYAVVTLHGLLLCDSCGNMRDNPATAVVLADKLIQELNKGGR